MGIAWTWLRIEQHRNLRSLLGLTLLVALASGAVLTAWQGAARGLTALPRLEARTLPSDLVVLPNQPGFDWDAVRALPEVAALSTFIISGIGIEGETLDDFSTWFPPTDFSVMRDVERPVVIEGRMWDPERPDEILVSPGYLAQTGHRVGDVVELELASPSQIDASFTGGTGIVPDGPRIAATIVGAVRSPWYSSWESSGGGLYPGPAIYRDYAPNLEGTQGLTYINALVRLKDGQADADAFLAGLAEVSGRTDIEVWRRPEQLAPVAHAIRVENLALLAIGAAGALAAAVLVGQAVTRSAAATAAELGALRASGLGPGALARVAAAPVTAYGALGALLGAGGAAVASRWFPLGMAGTFESAPGIAVSWPLTLGVLALCGTGVWLTALASAAVTTAARDLPAHGSVLAARASARGWPVPAVMGLRFALEPGRGTRAVPLRPAYVGAVAGVLGVTAAFTFGAGLRDGMLNPDRYGGWWDAAAIVESANQVLGDPEQMLDVLSQDADVAGVADVRASVAEIGTATVATQAMHAVGDPDLVTVAGRMPQEVGEIALAPSTMANLGLRLGDTTLLEGPSAEAEVTVVGSAFVMPGHNSYAEGAWVSLADYARIFAGHADKSRVVTLTYRDGVDPSATTARLAESYLATTGAPLLVMDFVPPEAVLALEGVGRFPIVLGAFLAVLAVGAVAHALALTIRRRRHDLAVLRALGMTPGGSRVTVLVQAVVLALVGLAIGVPLGIAVGRGVWRLVAEGTPVAYVPPTAVTATAILLPVTVALVLVLAAPPALRAGRSRVAPVLRAE